MKKKFLFVIVLLSFFIPVKTFGLSGDISFSCNSTTVNVGDEVRCKITGTSDGSVSEVFSNLTSDGNIIVTNFKAERIWKINSEWPNLSLSSADKYPGNFELGTVYLKAVAGGVGTFYMNGITFTSDNGEVATIPNKSVVITVISNTPAPTPDPTPVEPVKSSDATLKSLNVNDIDINFNPSINEYNIEVSSNVNSVRIDAVANNNKAKVKLPTSLSLVTGANQFLIEVVAEDGTILNYKVNVTRLEKLLSDNALLSNIKIDGYDLNFSSDVFEYNIGIIKNNYLDISAITEDGSATVVITGNSNIGKDDSIIIKVTSEAGSVKKYIIYASYVGDANEVKSNDLLLIIVSGLFVFSSFLVLLLVIKRRRKNKKNSTGTGRAAIDATLMKDSKKGEAVPLQLKRIETVKKEAHEVKKAKEEKIKADKKKIKEAMEKIKREKAEQKRLEKEKIKREIEEKKKEKKEKALREREEREKARLLNEEKQKQEREQALKEKEERERQRRDLEEKMKAEKLAKIEQEKAEKERLRLEKEAKLKEEKEREEKIKAEKEKQRLEKIQRDKERKELEAKARAEQERQKKIAEEQAKAEKERQRREKEEQEKALKEKEQKEKEIQEKEKIDLIKKQQELEQTSKVDTANTGEKISSEVVLETVKVTPKEEAVADNNNANTSDGKLDVSKEKTHSAVVTDKKQVERDAKDIGAPEVSEVVNTVVSTPVAVEEEPEVLDMNVTVISPEQVLSAVKVGVKKEEPKVDNKSKRKKGRR